MLLEAGADIDARSRINRSTSLHKAASYGHTAVIQLLLERGAKIDASGNHGETPLHSAAIKGFGEAVELLAKRGTELEALVENRLTALHLAVMENHKKVINVLLRLGADINAKGEYGFSPLAIAASERHKRMARLLIAHEANVNATGQDLKGLNGMSMLLIAVSRGHTEIVKILIESGADVNVEDGKDWNALDWATARADESTLELLPGRGAALILRKREEMRESERLGGRRYSGSIFFSNAAAPESSPLGWGCGATLRMDPWSRCPFGALRAGKGSNIGGEREKRDGRRRESIGRAGRCGWEWARAGCGKGEDGVTAGVEGEAAPPWVGVGTPRSRDAVGEGGDDSYTAQSGRCASLLVTGGGASRLNKQCKHPRSAREYSLTKHQNPGDHPHTINLPYDTRSSSHPLYIAQRRIVYVPNLIVEFKGKNADGLLLGDRLCKGPQTEAGA
jgi:ankyrin repeat protein